MLSLYKIWAAANLQENWTYELENFILAKLPQTHEDLERAIQEYQSNKK